ncbi:hypothetical protein UlMin_009585 [Ulmus minor]
MALKSFLFVFLLVGVMAAPIAEAQLGGLGGLGGIVGGLLGLIRIQGSVSCSLNGGINANGIAAPAFPNALVQLQCGNGTVVSSSTTNSGGIFSMVLDPFQFILSSLLTDCRLAVATPLASCNASLPSVGGLLSPLQFIGNTLNGLLNIANIIPAGFKFQP